QIKKAEYKNSNCYILFFLWIQFSSVFLPSPHTCCAASTHPSFISFVCLFNVRSNLQLRPLISVKEERRRKKKNQKIRVYTACSTSSSNSSNNSSNNSSVAATRTVAAAPGEAAGTAATATPSLLSAI